MHLIIKIHLTIRSQCQSHSKSHNVSSHSKGQITLTNKKKEECYENIKKLIISCIMHDLLMNKY